MDNQAATMMNGFKLTVKKGQTGTLFIYSTHALTLEVGGKTYRRLTLTGLG